MWPAFRTEDQYLNRCRFDVVSLVAISVVLWWSALGSLFALALHDEQYTHILLILPISAAFILLEWRSSAGRTKSSIIVGSVLLLAALLAKLFATGLVPADIQLSLNILALVGCWIGSSILCYGSSAFRRALFPLFFLLWLVPLPQFVLNFIVTLLQKGSAASAFLFFQSPALLWSSGALCCTCRDSPLMLRLSAAASVPA